MSMLLALCYAAEGSQAALNTNVSQSIAPSSIRQVVHDASDVSGYNPAIKCPVVLTLQALMQVGNVYPVIEHAQGPLSLMGRPQV